MNEHNHRDTKGIRKTSGVNVRCEHSRSLVNCRCDGTAEAIGVNSPRRCHRLRGSPSDDEVDGGLKRTSRVSLKGRLATVLLDTCSQSGDRATDGAGSRRFHHEPRESEEGLEHQCGVYYQHHRAAVHVHGDLGEPTLDCTTRMHSGKPCVDDGITAVAAHQVLHRDQDIRDGELAVASGVTDRVVRSSACNTVPRGDLLPALRLMAALAALTALAAIARDRHGNVAGRTKRNWVHHRNL